MSSNMDELLRRALMEANALDAEEISAPPGRSAHYQRERLRLCASPFGWAKAAGKAAVETDAPRGRVLFAYRHAPVRHAYGSQPNGPRGGGTLVYRI